MALRGFEDRLERLVEGFFARAFRSGLQPVELGRKIGREMDRQAAVDVAGDPIAPNVYRFRLAPSDYERFQSASTALVAELEATVRDKARESGLGFLGGVAVALVRDEEIREGVFKLQSFFDDSVEVRPRTAWLDLPDGARLDVVGEVLTLGRAPESHLVLADPNASRRHAEICISGDGYALVDLGSTNGSRVNGQRISNSQLADGDELRFGSIQLTFRMP